MPRRGSPSPLLNLPLLIIILPSNWDSLYVFLVLLAILCGVFARRNDDESTSNEDNPGNHDKLKRDPVSNAPWFADDLPDPKIYAGTNNSSPLGGAATTAAGYRLRMGSSSCPDLMQDSFWKTPDDLSRYRSPIHHRRHQSGEFEESRVKDIPVDTFVRCSSSMLQSPPPPKTFAPPPPPPPPPPPTATKSNQKQKRTCRKLPRETEKAGENDHESTKIKASPPTPPPPPPRLATPAPPKKMQRKQKTQVSPKNDALRSPMEPPSLGTFTISSSSSSTASTTAATINKLTRHKSQVPLPPPEPPRRRKSSTTGLPPLPKRVDSLYEDNVINGGQSPLVAMPPLSPPPPCQMPGSQSCFQRGICVETRSAQSSRCSSPNSEEVDKESKRQTVNKTDGMDGIGGPSFCPSPDVNMKAETFIARLRDGWRLEKMNSLREKGSVDQVPGTDPAKI
uniref:Uncharacterized protein n=1 Tax=Salix viminalis TaxID=40686 RepID=A0A6N2N001_SALVM